MIFPLVPLIFYFGAKPQLFRFLFPPRAHVRRSSKSKIVKVHLPSVVEDERTYTRACARGQRPLTHVRTCIYTRMYGVVPGSREEPYEIPYIGIYGERKTIPWCPCTPPLTMETFGERISAEVCSGKEIAGLLKKKR